MKEYKKKIKYEYILGITIPVFIVCFIFFNERNSNDRNIDFKEKKIWESDIKKDTITKDGIVKNYYHK
jgi:hypothetical protein